MPVYTHLRTFVNALKSGKTHITDCLDQFFSNPATVQAHPRFGAFSSDNWANGVPSWLGDFLDEIGLKPEERDHVLRYSPAELEKTRAAAAAAVTANQPTTFRWGLYDGAQPVAVVRTGAAGNPEVLFQSPGRSVRLTSINYGELYVEDV